MKKSMKITTSIIFVLCVIILCCILVYITLIPSAKNAYDIRLTFEKNKNSFNQIISLLKEEGNKYWEDDDRAGTDIIEIKNESEPLFDIYRTDGTVVKNLTADLSDEVIITLENTNINNINTFAIYFDKNRDITFTLKIIFEFKGIENAYLVYYEGESSKSVYAPTEHVWETMELGDCWYVCFEKEEINSKS